MVGRDVTLFAAARRRLGLVLVSTGAGLAAAVVTVGLSTSTYTSTAQLYVSITPEATNGRDIFGSLPFVEGRAATYASLVQNLSFQDGVGAAVGAATDVTAVVDPNTALLRLSATGPTPRGAQSATAAAVARLQQIAPPLDMIVAPDAPAGSPLMRPVALLVSERPSLPITPTSPIVPLFLVVGVLVGAGIGLAAATLAARFDDRLLDPLDLVGLTDQLGPIFWLPNQPRYRAPSDTWHQDYVLRLAALHHEFTALPQSRGNVLVLTAATPLHVPSASRVAADLADTLSLGGRSTALVVMHTDKPVSTEPGLSDLVGHPELSSSIGSGHGTGRLTIGPGSQPLRLLTAPEAEITTMLTELMSQAEIIVIDAPNLAAPAGTAVLSSMADAVLIVAARGEARAEELLDARAAIERWDAPYLGLLLAPQMRTFRARLPRRQAVPMSTPPRIDTSAERPNRDVPTLTGPDAGPF